MNICRIIVTPWCHRPAQFMSWCQNRSIILLNMKWNLIFWFLMSVLSFHLLSSLQIKHLFSSHQPLCLLSRPGLVCVCVCVCVILWDVWRAAPSSCRSCPSSELMFLCPAQIAQSYLLKCCNLWIIRNVYVGLGTAVSTRHTSPNIFTFKLQISPCETWKCQEIISSRPLNVNETDYNLYRSFCHHDFTSTLDPIELHWPQKMFFNVSEVWKGVIKGF